MSAADAKAAADQLSLWKYPNTTQIDGGKIYTNSITANQIQVDNLSAISANLGTLITYKDPANPNGARMVLEGSLIRVYDDNNIMRVRMGLW